MKSSLYQCMLPSNFKPIPSGRTSIRSTSTQILAATKPSISKVCSLILMNVPILSPILFRIPRVYYSKGRLGILVHNEILVILSLVGSKQST
jgi:hypothetical protein